MTGAGVPKVEFVGPKTRVSFSLTPPPVLGIEPFNVVVSYLPGQEAAAMYQVAMDVAAAAARALGEGRGGR